MLYIVKPPNFPYTSSAINMWIMNQFHTHLERNKTQQKNSSNPVKLRSRGGGEGEIARWRRDRAMRSSGAVWSSDWSVVRLARWSDYREGEARLAELGVSWIGVSGWIGVGFQLSSLLSLSLSLSLSFARDPEMNWSENESVKSFPGQRSKFLVKGNDFPENRIFRSCQTRGSGGKWFPKTIFTQNKRTLSVLVEDEHRSKLMYFLDFNFVFCFFEFVKIDKLKKNNWLLTWHFKYYFNGHVGVLSANNAFR